MRGKVIPALDSLMTFVFFFIYSGYSLRQQINRSEYFIRFVGHIQDANNAKPFIVYAEIRSDRTAVGETDGHQ